MGPFASKQQDQERPEMERQQREGEQEQRRNQAVRQKVKVGDAGEPGEAASLLRQPWREGIPVEWKDKKPEEYVSDQIEGVRNRHCTIQELLKDSGVEPEKKQKVLILGNFGSGKSSFINGINAALTGEYVETATVKESDTHVTTEHWPYTIAIPTPTTKLEDSQKDHQEARKADGKEEMFVLQFVDVPGLDMTEETQAIEQFKAAIIGQLKTGHKMSVEDKEAIKKFQELEAAEQSKLSRKYVAGVVWVSDIRADTNKDDKKVSALMSIATTYRIPQILVLTHVDHIAEEIEDGLSKMYFSKCIYDKLKERAKAMGINRNRTFPIKNYTEEMEVTPDRRYQYLHVLTVLLNEIIASLNFFIRTRNDAEGEQEQAQG